MAVLVLEGNVVVISLYCWMCLQMSLTISLRLISRQHTIKRTLSSAKGGVFGARIKMVAK